VIPEEYEDSGDSDSNDGVILSKQERRRLNQLNLRRENNRPTLVGLSNNAPSQLDVSGATKGRRQIATPASDDSQFDIL